MNVDSTEQPRVLSLCSGYDGIGLGLRRVFPGCKTVAHVEIESFACFNLVKKMEEGFLDPCPIWSDLKTFPAWSFQGCVDILTAGFPCQPFSLAGSGAADRDPRHLWPYVRQAVGLIRPGLVVLENVPGIISARLKGDDWNDPAGTPVLLHVLRELERTGYKATWGLFSAEEVGAPHRRERVFIVAKSVEPGSWKPSWEAYHKKRSSCQNRGASLRRKGEEPAGDPRSRSQPGELGDPEHDGLVAPQVTGGIGQPSPDQQEGTDAPRQPTGTGGSTILRDLRWPSRPGEPQQPWEPPRTMGDPNELIPVESEGAGDDEGGRASHPGKEGHQGSPQPGLGRKLDGSPHRMDRIQLLGNGVVPECAEVAIISGLRELA